MADEQTDSYDVIVIGGGAMGSSAALTLSRRGLRVLCIEQFTPAHALGSSHGSTRIVRQAYFEKPDYVPLLQRSYELWDELSRDFGEPLFVRCGALMIGRADSEVVTGTLTSARRWGLPHEVLDAAAMRARYPQFSLPEDHIAVLETNAGYARAEASVLASIELAIDAGAEFWFETEVEAVELGPQGVHVQLSDAEVTAPKVVIATGAWAPRLANVDRYGITVTRQTVHWYRPVDGDLDRYRPDQMPVYLWQWPDGPGGADTEIYGFPYLDGEPGVKLGLYRDGPVTDPDSVDRIAVEADTANLRPVLEKSLPGLAGERMDGVACMYAGAPGDDFVLGVHPGSSGRVVVAVGFSGHGFKFMPVVGEIVADLVITGDTRHDIGFLSPERFG